MDRRTWVVCLGVVMGLGVALRAGVPAQDPPPLPRAGTLTADEFPTFKTGGRCLSAWAGCPAATSSAQ